jgi:nitroreductase
MNIVNLSIVNLAIALAILAIVLMYAWAFVRGRALSFWPPRIEGRPMGGMPRAGSSGSVQDAIRIRKSVRAYSDRQVEEDKLEKVLEAGRQAPSASNRQEWRFVVVRDPETRSRIGGAVSGFSAFVGKAPVIVVACADTSDHVMQCGQPSYAIDVAIALDHMALASIEEGLGTCWVGMFSEDGVKKALGIPEQVRAVLLMTLGYPADPSPIQKKRLPLDKVVKFDHW